MYTSFIDLHLSILSFSSNDSSTPDSKAQSSVIGITYYSNGDYSVSLTLVSVYLSTIIMFSFLVCLDIFMISKLC